MNSLRAALAAVGPLLLISCNLAPKPFQGSDAAASVIGIRVEIALENKFWWDEQCFPNIVYFVRVNDEHPGRPSVVLASNFSDGGYVYLLDAVSGRYAAVGATRFTSSDPPNRRTFYFPEALIEKTAVTLEPASVAFMGELTLDGNRGMEEADEAQMLYHGIIADRNGHTAAEITFDRSQDAWQRFLERSRTVLGGAGWAPALTHPAGP